MIKKDFKLSMILDSANLAEKLSVEEQAAVGLQVTESVNQDLGSRQEWDRNMAAAMKMALQVLERKDIPWKNASNVKFPLITIAALQYQTRAYPALIPGSDIVQCIVVGPDGDGEKTKRADRISAHMSYQLLEEDEAWEEDQDKTLFVQALLGCAFKKTYFDSVEGTNLSSLVLPRDLVVPYYTKTLRKATRISHLMGMTTNELYELAAKGLFLECDTSIPESPPPITEQEAAKQKRQGVQQTTLDTIPCDVIEQHCWMDLDGDGYQEPYIVSVRRATGQLLRIVARFYPDNIKYVAGSGGKRIQRITPVEMFTKYPFVPSPDGGFYDIGLGNLLVPLTESINTLINQLIDAGTLANLGGGFLGRGVKLEGGQHTFQPGEWKRTGTIGGSLKDNIVPLPVPEPSQALLNLLPILIDYAERTVGATDLQQGQGPGQNTPAQTAQAMLSEGGRILNGIYKRTRRAFRDELRKLYDLNRIYLPVNSKFEHVKTGAVLDISVNDYREGALSVRPTAEPELSSDAMRLQQSTFLAERAGSAPGYSTYQVEKRVLTALKIPNIEEILPDPTGPNALPPPPPDPRIEVAELRRKTQMFKYQIDARLKALRMVKDAELAEAKIASLNAQATKLMAEAESVSQQKDLEAIRVQIGALKSQNETLLNTATFLRDIISEEKPDEQTRAEGPEDGVDAGGIPNLATGPGDTGASDLPAPGAEPTF
ncbi:MAG: hypothetical protein MN733_26235 [Nitrososphaera sp.]|nr:hypothetical protein [Nitrososphaera sp.]